jgi:hypothetical protein
VIFVALFIGELLILFLLARALTQHLGQFLYRVGFGDGAVMHSVAFLFFPGTFLHEMSHYLMSVLLRVRVFSMSLWPKAEGNGYIKLGTVQHAKCDLIRDLMIGVAPFIIGNIILFSLLFFYSSHNFPLQSWLTVLVAIVVFEIGNTMFSSRADMQSALKFLLILLVIFGFAYLLGWRISIEQLDQNLPGSWVNLIKQASLFLAVPIGLDILVIGLVNILSRLF